MFTEQELNVVLDSLSEKPYREVAGLFGNIQQQIQAQHKQVTETKEEKGENE